MAAAAEGFVAEKDFAAGFGVAGFGGFSEFGQSGGLLRRIDAAGGEEGGGQLLDLRRRDGEDSREFG